LLVTELNLANTGTEMQSRLFGFLIALFATFNHVLMFKVIV